MKTACLYARISTVGNGQDTDNQLVLLREYCRKQGYTIVHEYVDYASGGTGDRAQFQAMFKAAHQKTFDLCIFWALDRFSREGARETINYLAQLESYGVGFISYTEPYLNSIGIFKDAIISILATLAKQEKMRISERVKAGLARVKSQGRVLGAKKKPLDLDRVRELKAQGLSLRAIAKEVGVSTETVRRRS